MTSVSKRVEEREAGVVVVDDALESVDDAAEKFREFAADDQEIVDFEKNLEAVTLAGELRLIGLGSLKIEGVIDRDGHLAGDALHELEFGVGDALGNDAAEAHRAETALSGGERKNRQRTHIVFTEALHEFRVARFHFGVCDDVGLLRLPDPAGRMALHGVFDFRGFRFRGGDARLEDMQAHDVLEGVVKDEGEEIEVDDGMEAAGEVVEKRWKIALLCDGLADFEQGFELTPGVLERGGKRHFRRGDDGIRHRRQDNTGVGGGST